MPEVRTFFLKQAGITTTITGFNTITGSSPTSPIILQKFLAIILLQYSESSLAVTGCYTDSSCTITDVAVTVISLPFTET